MAKYKRVGEIYHYYIRKVVVATTFLLFFGGTVFCEDIKINSFSNPDFAFPQTVDAGARMHLNKAFAAGNQLEALQAGVQMTIARTLISSDSITSALMVWERLIPHLSGPYKSLGSMLEAKLLTDVYCSNRRIFDGRVLPAGNVPEDPMLWSKEIFNTKIKELICASLSEKTGMESKLSVFSPLLVNTEQADIEGMVLYDFLGRQGISLLSSLGIRGDQEIIPFFRNSDLLQHTGARGIADSIVEFYKNQGLLDIAAGRAIVLKGEYMDSEERTEMLYESLMNIDLKIARLPIVADYFSQKIYPEFVDSGEETSLSGKKSQISVENFYKLCQQLRSLYPTFGNEILSTALNQLSEEVATYNVKDRFTITEKPEFKVCRRNLNDGAIMLYRLNNYSGGSLKVGDVIKIGSLLAVYPLDKTQFTIPFNDTVSLSIPNPGPGVYAALFSPNGEVSGIKADNKKNFISTFCVSSINVVTLNGINGADKKNAASIYVVDAATMLPIKGAIVTLTSTDRKKEIKRILTTNDQGFVEIPSEYRSCNAEVSYKLSKVNIWADRTDYNRPGNEARLVNVFTDLSIYKPGQEIGFSAIAFKRQNDILSLCPAEELSAILCDANGNEVERATIATDQYGRAAGKFSNPVTGLLGRWNIRVEYAKTSGKDSSGSGYFDVAEYKAPSFFVSLQKDKADESDAVEDERTTVDFSGTVTTYSGMPLGCAQINYKVNFRPFWYRMNSSTAFYGGECSTDEKGNFKFSLPITNLKNTRFEYGVFTVDAVATLADGESQSSSPVTFSLRKSYTIEPVVPSIIEVDSTAVKLKVVVRDISGYPTPQLVHFSLSRRNNDGGWDVINSGKFSSPNLTLPSTAIPSGEYRLIFTLDNAKSVSDFIVFRRGESTPPVKKYLWVPQHTVIAPEFSKTVDVTVGNSYVDTKILCIVSDKNGIISRYWLQPKGKNISVKVPAPATGNVVWVRFYSTHNFEDEANTVTVKPSSSAVKLKVSFSSFRDKVYAGGKENWNFGFSLSGPNGNQPTGIIPVLAVMSNKSLDALSNFRWHFSPQDFIYLWNSSYISTLSSGTIRHTVSFGNNNYKRFSYCNPEWNFYDRPFFGGNRYGTMLKKELRIRGRGSVEEVAVEEQVYMNSATTKTAKAMDFNEAVESEMIAEDSVVESGSVTEGVKGTFYQEEKFRETEFPLAFFKPELKTDSAGLLNLDFTIPDFNTTWKLQLLAYTADLKTEIQEYEIIASKPVMIQTNMPSFLRTYDETTLKATIFNNSDKELELNGSIEVLNSETGKIIASRDFSEKKVDPSASRPIELCFSVPTEISGVIIRSKGWTYEISDGEQAFIPVLPASQPVIDSETFYLPPSKERFEVKIPSIAKESSVTLQYCDNPIWFCLTALPGLIDSSAKNSLSLANAFYADNISIGMIAKYPKLHDALAGLFKSSEGEGLLKSELFKNEDLKIAALENTPWVNNANSEQLRLADLTTLLDKQKAEKSLKDTWNKLESLRTPEGGWSWCPKMDASLFITTEVLRRIGRLRYSGYLSVGGKTDGGVVSDEELCSSIDKSVSEAINYADREMINDYRKYGDKTSLATSLNYLYARSFFRKDSGSAEFLALRNRAIKRLKDSWKKMSIADKAVTATLLYREGEIQIARTILQSLGQYSSYIPEQGRWFDNLKSADNGIGKLLTTSRVLTAYSEIYPDAPEVDQIRQWLILERRGEDWGADSHLCEVVNSLLTSGSDWTSEGLNSALYVDGKMISPSKTEQLSGMLTITLNSEDTGKELKIEKKSSGPSWGGILSQYVAPMTEVKAEKIPELSLTKEIFVVNTESDGTIATDRKVLKSGDKIRVTMTLINNRDLNYVVLTDERPACFIPTLQISDYLCNDGVWVYNEVRTSKTSIFVSYLPKGKHIISYDCYVTREGVYSSGIATVQSQYSPAITAHSSGELITVE